jgi:hypothetical protein
MNRTIEQSTLLKSAERLQPRRKAKLVAQWQSGLQTLAGYEQRKLRLVFARLPLDARQTCLTPNET